AARSRLGPRCVSSCRTLRRSTSPTARRGYPSVSSPRASTTVATGAEAQAVDRASRRRLRRFRFPRRAPWGGRGPRSRRGAPSARVKFGGGGGAGAWAPHPPQRATTLATASLIATESFDIARSPRLRFSIIEAHIAQSEVRRASPVPALLEAVQS